MPTTCATVVIHHLLLVSSVSNYLTKIETILFPVDYILRILETLKISLANQLCDQSDVSHGKKLLRWECDVITFDDVS